MRREDGGIRADKREFAAQPLQIEEKWPLKVIVCLSMAYGDHAPSEKTCRKWFVRVKSGNGERGRPPKKFKDVDLLELLDEEDAHTQAQLAAALQCDRSSISTREMGDRMN